MSLFVCNLRSISTSVCIFLLCLSSYVCALWMFIFFCLRCCACVSVVHLWMPLLGSGRNERQPERERARERETDRPRILPNTLQWHTRTHYHLKYLCTYTCIYAQQVQVADVRYVNIYMYIYIYVICSSYYLIIFFFSFSHITTRFLVMPTFLQF